MKFVFIFLSFLLIFTLVKNQDETTPEEETTTQEEETTTVDDVTDDPESTTPTFDLSEYSQNYTPYPTGGVLVQYTQKGLDYIIGMAEFAAQKLMSDFPIPDTEQDGFAMKKVKVLQFDPPKLKAKFINQTGMQIDTTVPKLETTASYSGSMGWFSTSGTVKCNIQGLVVSMLVRIERGQSGFPALAVPMCQGKVEKFRIVFSDAGWGGTVLNSMRGFVESVVVTSLGNIICLAAKNLTGIIESVFLDWEKQSPFGPPKPAAAAAKIQTTLAPGAALDMGVICGQQMDKMKGDGGVANHLLAEMDGLSIDMKMDGDAHFDEDEVLIGLNGDFTVKGQKTGLKPKQKMFLPPKTDRSLCFAVNEIVPNSFGLQGQKNNYFVLKKKLESSDLPPEATPIRVLCGGCKMQVYASTAEAPRVEFTKTGVKSVAKTFLRIDGRGLFNTKLTIVEAVADIEAMTNLIIEKNTIQGTVELGKINVKIQDVGVGGVFDKPLNAFLRKIIPKAVWPAVRNRINKMIKEKGFKLPAMCGLSFNNTQIIYQDGSVVVCSDFDYDIAGLLNRMTEWQRRQLPTTTANPDQAGEPTDQSEQPEQQIDQSENSQQQTPPPSTTIRTLSRAGDGLSKLKHKLHLVQD